MGSALSRAKLIIGTVVMVNQVLDTLSKRLKTSPGLPVSNPTLPFWTVPKSTISSDGRALPARADIVIIGSGITGASVAYYALSRVSTLKIVVLEARDVCSGATGRNGGHVNPPLFQGWSESKKNYGIEQAKALVRFRLAHLREMQSVASAEDIVKDSQLRDTEHLEVYYTEDALDDAREDLKAWKADMPEEAEHYTLYEGEDAVKKFHLAANVTGCVWGPGGAMHPYRFVTGLFEKLLDRHKDNFFIATNTSCTAITEPTPASPFYTLTTPSGTLTAPHIVHATNGWVSHLLSPMRAKIAPARGTMSAQRPGTSLRGATQDGLRSYVFYPGSLGYDYLTQLPAGEHELMFGGGWASAFDAALANVGLADDSAVSMPVASHLAGALPMYFGSETWGREKAPEEDGGGGEWARGRTKAQWSGILGISADGLPWVGRVPRKISGRGEPPAGSAPRYAGKDNTALESGPLTAAPGEWISAGYTGEGMVQAWMSGKALAYMVLGTESDTTSWFPEILRITEERWKKANFEDFIARRMGGMAS